MRGAPGPGAWTFPAALIASVTVLRVWESGLAGLGDAEAYYFSWSEVAAPSYLDHGPVVAYLIRLGTTVGGNSPLGVRWPFILLSAITLWRLAVLARRLGGGAESACWAVALLFAVPAYGVAGAAATPDGPLLLFTLLFLECTFYVHRRREGPALWVAGLLLGLAFSCKYFGLLLALPLWLATRELTGRRRLLHTTLAGLFALLAAAPVLIWNAANGWPSLRYHLGLRHTQPIGPSPENLAKLVGGQLAYLSPLVLAVLAATAIWLWRRRREPSLRPLAAVAAPLSLVGLLLIGLVPNAEPHWPAPGYLPLLGAAGTLLPGWLRARPRLRPWVCGGLALSMLLGVLLHLHLLTDLGVRAMPASYRPRYDLSNELHGWPHLSERVARQVALHAPSSARLAQVAGCHYTVCAQLRFWSRGRYSVVCPSPRLDAFDFFPGGDGSSLRGVDLLYLRDERFPYEASELYRCKRTKLLEVLPVVRGGRTVRRFELQLCQDFEGLRATVWPPRP
ncbi:MAG: glycosyltransferase family 39 protein [Deltaproteobacteria bacterium]|nr:glycosyltransferase family 39 protein [Deltaproteobacteria bacterium]